MSLVIPINNQFSYNNIPRNKDLGLEISNTCNIPHRALIIDWKGDCFVCTCEAWLPISVGNIMDFERLADIWTSPAARELQEDVDSRRYTHCAVNLCGITQQHIVHSRYHISINIDESCNLWCPSCRRGRIMITEGEEHDKKLRQAQHIVSLLEGFTEPCTIVMSGNGDPLASSIMPPLIHAYRPGPQQEIKLFTNGLLIKKQLSDSPIAAHIKSYLISIDAGSAEVYEQVRLGGRWHILMENFDFLRDLAQEHRAQVALTMVLQRANHSDIANFAELCIRYDFAGSVTRLDNWGTWLDFANEDVIGNHHHAEHELAMQNLRSAYQQYRKRITFAPALAQLVKV